MHREVFHKVDLKKDFCAYVDYFDECNFNSVELKRFEICLRCNYMNKGWLLQCGDCNSCGICGHMRDCILLHSELLSPFKLPDKCPYKLEHLLLWYDNE